MSTAASDTIKRPNRLGVWLIVAIIVGVTLVATGLAAGAGQPAATPPRLASMAESAQALARAGTAMQVHGQAMLDDGQRTGDQDVIRRGDHWRRDGQALLQGGQWLAMDPTALGSLLASRSELAQQGNWGPLTRAAQAMLHDPSQARAMDLEALRWNGLAMRAEGQTMAEHGRVMTEEIDLMVARYGLSGHGDADVRQAAQTMTEVGATLRQNGQRMVDYADQFQRSLGAR